MRLARAARFGDTVTAQDAYGTDTFKCQLAPLDMFRVEGVRIKVKQLSTGPDVVMPARGAVRIDTQVYIISHGSPDFWKGDCVRRNYVTQAADGLATIISIADALADAAGTQAYAAAEFSRYLPEAGDSSKLPPQYEMFLAETESVPADTLISLNSKWYLVKESYQSASGVRVALANILDEPLFETVTFGSRTYDPITDTNTGSPATVKIMRVKWTEHYTYLSIGSETYERGDQQVFMPKSVSPKASDTLTLSDGTWRVLAVQNEDTRWSCHVRRA